ncbi:hypothetical protein ACTWP5_00795 [Streptomyces sp. 4N509B]|uniref:hypothetical protein n=1 Tax=Streptomyces sp. 4N509B TaxID=3457413 RepID=UPI003FD0A524
MAEEVKLSPEEVDRVKGIIAQAQQDMNEVATGIGGHAGTVQTAYNGSGTATAVQNYENLGRAGEALSRALAALSQDLGVTAATGRETDQAAHSVMNRVVTPGAAPDPSIARAI